MGAVAGFEPGSLIGKYAIERELGRGGMGVVYLAEDTTLSRKVALKVLYPSLSSDAVFVERFRQEAKIVAGILHPNVVRINSLENIGNQLVIDMEYVPGSSLGEALEHEVFTPQFAVQLARDVFAGLAICHAHEIIHRDIKPSNILLASDGSAKLADFGLATAYAAHLESTVYRTSSSGYFLGTPRFSPPEAWEGAEPAPDWDLYSFGLVLYEGLTGRRVYDGTTPLTIVKQMMTKTVVPTLDVVPMVSKPFGELIDRMISRNGEDRPQSVLEAAEALRATPEYGQTVGTDSPTVQTMVHRLSRRRERERWMGRLRKAGKPVLGALAMLGIGLGIGWYALSGYGTEASYTPAGKPAAPLKTQSDIAKLRLYDESELLDLARDDVGKETIGFNVRYFAQSPNGERRGGETTEVMYPNVWILTPVSGAEYQLFGIGAQSLMVCRLSIGEDDNVGINGDWAGYSYPRAMGFVNGKVSGTGAWIDRNMINASLRFENDLVRTSEQFSVAAIEPAERYTDTKFVHALEGSDVLQPLIYHELRPRNLAWVDDVESLLPCLIKARCVIPIIGSAPQYELNGRLEEPVWSDAYFDGTGRIGSLAGKPDTIGSVMIGRACDEELWLGFEMNRVPPGRWGFRAIFMPMLAGPISMQSRMMISYEFGKEQEAHQFVGSRETPWTCEWESVLSNDEDSAGAEIRIPFDTLKELAHADAGGIWRMNAQFVEVDGDGNYVPLVAWGYPEFSRVEHGAILTFRRPLS